jgi:hypothetical protein
MVSKNTKKVVAVVVVVVLVLALALGLYFGLQSKGVASGDKVYSYTINAAPQAQASLTCGPNKYEYKIMYTGTTLIPTSSGNTPNITKSIPVSADKKLYVLYDNRTNEFHLFQTGQKIAGFQGKVLGFAKGVDSYIFVNLGFSELPADIKSLIDPRLNTDNYVMWDHTNDPAWKTPAVVVSPIVSFDLKNDSFCSPIQNWWYNQFTLNTL